MSIQLSQTIDWYDRNAEEYSVKEFIYPEDTKQFERFCDAIPKEGKILDAGCGAGGFAGKFANLGFETIGLDLSEKLLEIARKDFPQVEFTNGDIRELPYDDQSFDGVWAHASIVHLPEEEDVAKTLKEFSRILKNGGVVHINVKKRNQNKIEEGQRFYRFYDEGELSELMISLGFKILNKESYNELERNEVGRSDTNWINILAQKN